MRLQAQHQQQRKEHGKVHQGKPFKLPEEMEGNMNKAKEMKKHPKEEKKIPKEEKKIHKGTKDTKPHIKGSEHKKDKHVRTRKTKKDRSDKGKEFPQNVTSAKEMLPKPFQGQDYTDDDGSWPCQWGAWQITGCYQMNNPTYCENYKYRNCEYKKGVPHDGCCCRGGDRAKEDYRKCPDYECGKDL